MELKEYQRRILDELSDYLSTLRKERDNCLRYAESDDEVIRKAFAERNFAEEAFSQHSTVRSVYQDKRDGLGNPLPDVYIKVPTGGGKTLLAVHAIDAIRSKYLLPAGGITLWIVPTEQIYRQTLQKLKDRHHIYHQILEVASGGRVLVRERSQKFTPAECASSHVILLLMLPAANRRNNETLRMFKDSGGFDAFFPPEDCIDEHQALLEDTPNLDYFESAGFPSPQIKSSLGNVLRLHRPLIVVDEGQRAYSAGARETICGFNPSFVLELSATPPPESNVLAQASGRELDREEMIKLDINLVTREEPDWKQTLFAAVRKRAELEDVAFKHQQGGGSYIRPIVLVQVENTGRNQRDANTIHSEDAREYLTQQCEIPPWQIAVKSSDVNELGDVNLLSEECEIRYIITKQALQEGWDCAFAYVLAVLSHLQAETAMAQLVGRVLRQPYAKKTGIQALDECYVYANRTNSGEAVVAIKRNIEEKEGLSGLGGCIRTPADDSKLPLRVANIHKQFNRFNGRIYLPQFTVGKGSKMRPLSYESDILAHLDWENLYHDGLAELSLEDARWSGQRTRIGWQGDGDDELRGYREGDFDADLPADPVLMTRQLLDVVPNPWHAYPKVVRILEDLEKKESPRGVVNGKTPQQRIAANFTFIVEEAKRLLAETRDKMAHAYFEKQVKKGVFNLVLLTKENSQLYIPKSVTVRSAKRMRNKDDNDMEKSLFDYVPDEEFNGLERSVALCLDRHEKLLWWYRNQVPGGYAIQGWKRHRIYPDFIAATESEKAHQQGKRQLPRMGKVLVIETKGAHLKGSDDTNYKRTLMELCNSAADAKLRDWAELAKDFADQQFRFQLVEEDGWENTLNLLLSQ